MLQTNLQGALCSLLLLLGITSRSQSNYTFNVMAPLYVHDSNWSTFENQLTSVENIGVQAVTTDVWWGVVEKNGDNQFDWSYYDKLVSTIKAKGLRWVPILSFHQCGGNVGDDFYAPLPDWLWDKLVNDSSLPLSDFTYVSEETCLGGGDFCIKVTNTYRKYSKEFVSLWTDAYVKTQYVEFMDAFKSHFADYGDIIDEINVSCGPAGELRYPSYNSHDWGGYPNRGTLQCYSNIAIKDFQEYAKNKYESISNLNNAWGTSLASFSDVNVPDTPNHFFSSKDYKNITYGKDFIGWYNASLMEHGNFMINLADPIFKTGAFANAKIGFKIPGIHWLMASPTLPRAAEVTAGLLPSEGTGLNCNYQGYETSIKQVFSDNLDKNRVQLHFTCLEMSNNATECNYQGSSEDYSMAQALVFWVGEAAQKQGITIKGENALSGGLNTDTGWNNIQNAFQYSSYSGITLLRIGDVSDPNQLGYQRLKALINQYK